MKLKLPQRIEFSDYHEFGYFQDKLSGIIPGIKCIEVGCVDGIYCGVVYLGNKREPGTAALIREIRKEEKECDRANGYW